MVFFDDQLIRIIQDLLAPTMDGFFVAVSDLGSTPLYLAIIALLYWTYDRRFAIRLAFVLLLTVFVNRVLKLGFRSPRPEADLRRVAETGYGFPSGHAQNAAAFWGYLSWESRRRAVLVIGIAMVFLVSLSRLYLGVHYLGDVVGGVLFGLAAVAAYRLVEPRLTPRLEGLTDSRKYLLAVIPAAAAFLIHLAVDPDTAADFAQVYGPVIALSTGYLLEGRFVGLGPAPNRRILILRMVMGLLLLGAAFVGLSLALPGDSAVSVFVRLLVSGYMVTPVAPWLFVKVEGRLSPGAAPPQTRR